MYVSAGMKLVTALVHVANSVSTELDNTQVSRFSLALFHSPSPPLFISARLMPRRRGSRLRKVQLVNWRSCSLNVLRYCHVHNMYPHKTLWVFGCSCSVIALSWGIRCEGCSPVSLFIAIVT